MIDLANKRFVIFGLPGSGKTELGKYILRSTRNHLVYDPLGGDPNHHDWDGFRRYVPDDRESVGEFNRATKELVIGKRPRLYLVDEANKYILPKPHPLPSAIADLNDLSRHWGITWGLIARRPVQFHTDVVELAHYVFVFGLGGKNDRAYLDSIISGLGDDVANLPKYHFAVVEGGRQYYIHSPISTGQGAAK